MFVRVGLFTVTPDRRIHGFPSLINCSIIHLILLPIKGALSSGLNTYWQIYATIYKRPFEVHCKLNTLRKLAYSFHQESNIG